MCFGISRYLCFLIFLTLWSCSFGYAFQNPPIELKRVRILDINQEAFSFEGVIEVSNPNDMSSRFSGYQYRLDVEGQRLATGESDQPFEVPAFGTFTIAVPATIRFQDLQALGKKDPFNRDLVYLLTGKVLLNSWLGKMSLPFSFEGTFNLADLLVEKTRRFLQGL
ncbi:MAG: LEA type 2 family protein [Deltaproteobacteria bacterium]|nr:LEA type 2 family protein [Deltaproteobacteria bacterium]